MSKNLSEEQLQLLQGLQNQFNQAKVEIADCEIKKASLIKSLESVQQQFSEQEKILMDEFGENAIINLQTGEVKDPEPEPKESLEVVK